MLKKLRFFFIILTDKFRNDLDFVRKLCHILAEESQKFKTLSLSYKKCDKQDIDRNMVKNLLFNVTQFINKPLDVLKFSSRLTFIISL